MSRPHPRRRPYYQRGQVVPLLALLLLLAGLLGVGIVNLGAAASRRAAAQTAADAAALAGAADGRAAAEQSAATNGARVVEYQEEAGDVLVLVERRGHRARARARWWPDAP